MSFLIQLRKELIEQWRTKRVLIVGAVLVLFGLASPLIAKLTPDLLKAVPGLPAGFTLPKATVADAVDQYVKNMAEFGVLLAVIITMGCVAQEKEKGTASLMLTHPLPRLVFLMAKFTAICMTFVISLFVSALGCWVYTLLLFKGLPWKPYLVMNGMMLIGFFVYIAVTLLCSTLVRSQGAAAGLSFTALVLIAGGGTLPRIGQYFPGSLFGWGDALAKGSPSSPAWPALGLSLVMMLAALLIAWLVFRRQEL
jgi:ABC-2 type transport system permease protein